MGGVCLQTIVYILYTRYSVYDLFAKILERTENIIILFFRFFKYRITLEKITAVATSWLHGYVSMTIKISPKHNNDIHWHLPPPSPWNLNIMLTIFLKLVLMYFLMSDFVCLGGGGLQADKFSPGARDNIVNYSYRGRQL